MNTDQDISSEGPILNARAASSMVIARKEYETLQSIGKACISHTTESGETQIAWTLSAMTQVTILWSSSMGSVFGRWWVNILEFDMGLGGRLERVFKGYI